MEAIGRNMKCSRKRQEKRFFFEKRTKKSFATAPNSSRIVRYPCAAPVAKVFASFFKRKRFTSDT
jgi:hypothetical protein